MTEIITQILVEVLSIFGIATKELKRGSASKFRRIACVCAFTKLCVERFLRKLAGMARLEEALKKLDRLTHEVARMAIAEVLRIAHSIPDGVEIMDGKVKEVVDKVRDIGDKVQMVTDGARGLTCRLSMSLNIYTFRRQGNTIGYATCCQRHR